MTKNLAEALEWITFILHKHRVPFQISGGLAAHVYGSKRPINDIDVDVPEDKMGLLLPDIGPYITFGPDLYRDERWNLKLITLSYKGQEIDIGGAFETKIFDDDLQTWVHTPARLELAKMHTIYGVNAPVVCPEDLIEYKRLLSGDHQKIDIQAIEDYLAKNT